MILDQKVRAVMSTEVRTIDVNEPLSAVRRKIEAGGFHHVPVTERGRLVGIVSAIDLARISFERWVDDKATRDAWIDRFRVTDVMTPSPEHLRPEDPIRVAAERLGDGAFHALPVIDADHHVVGIVTSTDLVRYLAGQLRG